MNTARKSHFAPAPLTTRRCPVCQRERGVRQGRFVAHYNPDGLVCAGSGRRVGGEWRKKQARAEFGK